MRQPRGFLSLDDVPLVDEECEECHGGGLCCPDDPLEEVVNYTAFIDDDFLEETLRIDRSPPAHLPPADAVGDGAEPMDVDELSGGVPKFSRTVRGGGGPETCAGPAGRLVPEEELPLTMEGLSLSPPWWEAQSPEPFNPSTVPRRRRCEPATVRKQPWRLALPPILLAAPCHGQHDKNSNGNSSRELTGGGGHRRSAGQRRSRQLHRTCRHCHTSETPQWRAGPDGPGTLCNACGIRYKQGNNKLVQEYRPSSSPSFRSNEHSNRHRKVEKLMREKKKTDQGEGEDPQRRR